MRLRDEGTFAVATVSIPLYMALLITCIYYGRKFWDVVNGTVQGGLYGTPKFVFFVVLGISALLDLPTFFTCVAKGGPKECIWDHETYAFVWSCHLIATCGYLYAVITPSILWSDIIRQKDGNFWNSSSPLDGTKIFFRVTYVLYCCVIFTNVLGVIIYSKSSDESNYSDSNALGAINNCLMPIMLVVITFGCFWSGLRLRQYVMNVQLGNAVQLRILLKLNFTMIMICASYVVRAILVMSLYEDVPQPYVHALHWTWQYPIWMPLTQWVPFVLCSFCLVNEMKFHDVGKGAARPGSTAGGAAPGRPSRLSTGPGRHSGAEGPVDVRDPSYEARSKNFSVDSLISDIARSETTAHSSAHSRSRYASTQESEKLDILMTNVGADVEGKARTVSADNFFDSHNDELVMSDSIVGSDHFFTTSAMHIRSSR